MKALRMRTVSRWVRTTYYYDKNWTFRTGIAYDDSPVPANKRLILFPIRTVCIERGVTYAFNEDVSIDVGASYMHGQNGKIHRGGRPGSLLLQV